MALLGLLVCLAWGVASASNGQRWSRQISQHHADSDWVPLPGPVQQPDKPKPTYKRQVAEPRILAEPTFTAYRPTGFEEPVPPRNYYTNNNNNKLYLQGFPAVPSAPQNYLTDNGFGHIRFGVGQPNNPLNQGFITSQFTFPHEAQSANQNRPPVPVSFPKVPIQNPSPPAKPFGQFPQYMKPVNNKFVDSYRPEGIPAPKKKPAPINDKLKPPTSAERFPVNKPKLEREEVQLLYVPADTLNQGQFNFKNSISQQVFNPNIPSQQAQVRQNFDTRPKFTDNFGPEYFSGFHSALGASDQSRYSTNASPFPQKAQPLTTPKPKKLKPHQPPLAIFVTDEARKGNQVKVGDVLSYLKSSNTIAVLDSVNPQNAPKVFIGPNNLNSPSHYVKFEVPYLSNIEHTDKKLRQLPFFVAPLSYHTPQGFAKIPFPSPHVGSVIINAQAKDNSQLKAPQPTEPNTPTPPVKEQRPSTQAPSLTYYSTSGPRNHPPTYDKQYYSFEPQTVSTLRPSTEPNPNIVTIPPGKPATYYVKNSNNDYSYANDNIRTPEPERLRTTAPTSTTTSTTVKPSTYPNRLLETHNPYSINQAFHLSTPLDYQKYYDEYREGYPGYNLPVGSTPPAPSSSRATKEPEKIAEKQTYQTPPAYTQNYSPEVQFESEVPNSRYNYNVNTKGNEYNAYNTNNKQKEVFNTDPFKPNTFINKPQQSNQFEDNSYVPQPPTNVQEYSQDVQNINQQSGSKEYTYSSQVPDKTRIETVLNNAYNSAEVSSASPSSTGYTDTYHSSDEKQNSISLDTLSNAIANPSTETTYTNEAVTQATEVSPGDYFYSSEETPKPITSSTTTRRPLRSRGRPRYTTPRSNDYTETTTRVYATRRPISRRPIPTRTRPDITRATTERPTRKLSSSENNEVTTKSSRGRTRGRVQYKPTASDESYDRKNKNNANKNDLAYQRDILHQNYPVTLSERITTHDVEISTESLPRLSSRIYDTTTQIYDSIDSNTNEKAKLDYAVSINSKEDSISYSSKTETQTEQVPKTSRWEDYVHSRSSTQAQGIDAISYDDFNVDPELIQTTPISSKTSAEPVTESNYFYSTVEEPKEPSNVAYATEKVEETTQSDIETTKTVSHEVSTEAEAEYNVVQTTPSFSRVRVRPGVVRQFHQASTTTYAPRVKGERKRPQQAVTYRPAYDRQRTTMRIEEIEQDLKTKQVLVRPEQNYKHPVYKPEPTTAAPTYTTDESVTKRTPNFRRRRPSITTTTAEPGRKEVQKERKNDLHNRFRGRRPTTEKLNKESEIETTTVTVRNYDRKSSRLKLSDRFQKRPETKEDNDQDIDDSINRPRFVSPNNKFTPIINPNFIYENGKGPTTERRSDFIQETDIITARNDDYGDILLSVTPSTNNKGSRVLSDLSPTLEALVEQSTLNATGSDTTFETMLQDVMRSIEQMDNREYNSTVMRLKDGEIGEIPPEKTFADEYPNKSTTLQQDEYTTVDSTAEENRNEPSSEKPRRGYWKKVKVRPVSNDPLEPAESQYYTSTVNKLGEPVPHSKVSHDKSFAPAKITVTTYKPAFQFLSSLFEPSADDVDVIPDIDIPKIHLKESTEDMKSKETEVLDTTVQSLTSEETKTPPSDIDLGTGTPDPTVPENLYYNTPTEPTASDRADPLSFMDYLFGVTSKESDEFKETNENNTTSESIDVIKQEIESNNEVTKPKLMTTESSYIPEEISTEITTEPNYDKILEDIKKLETVELKSEEPVTSTSVEKTVVRVESASESSFMDPTNVMSTSMSTEISHETEICFRGKCIKSSKDLL